MDDWNFPFDETIVPILTSKCPFSRFVVQAAPVLVDPLLDRYTDSSRCEREDEGEDREEKESEDSEVANEDELEVDACGDGSRAREDGVERCEEAVE